MTPSLMFGGIVLTCDLVVAAIACPKQGLLDFIRTQEDAATEWKMYLVDICLGSAVWKKAGTKTRRGLDFDGKWVLGFEYNDGKTAEEDDR